MIAKLVVWGKTRGEALDRLRRALDEYQVAGITTTLTFFRRVVRDKEFIAGTIDTGFISRFNERRNSSNVDVTPIVETDMAIIAAALHFAKLQRQSSVPAVSTVSDRWRMSGRIAALNSRQGMNLRNPSNRSKSGS